MKVIVYGQKNMDTTLSAMLKHEGIEMRKLEDDFNTTTNPSLEEKFDLAVVDSRSNNVNIVCRYIRHNWDIPIVLVIDSLETNWKGLITLGADGYIPEVKKGGELSARTRALLRRLLNKRFYQRKT